MQGRRIARVLLLFSSILILAPVLSRAQSMNAVLSGTVSDSSAATVPGATLTLTSQETRAVANFTTGTDGLYTFGNLPVGTYDLKVTAKGFRTYVQTSIKLHLGDTLRQDISLQVGTQVQEIQVLASPSPLNYENA